MKKASAIIRIILYSILILILTTLMLGYTGYNALASSTTGVETVDIAASEENVSYVEPGVIPVTEPDITKLHVNWVRGTITIQPDDVTEIQIMETGEFDPDYAMTTQHSNKGQLRIEFSQKSVNWVGQLLDNAPPAKDLTILLPRNMVLEEIQISTASATLDVQDLQVKQVKVDAASIQGAFTDCIVDELEVDSASGELEFTGTLNKLDFDSASGQFSGWLNNCPKEISMDGASNTLELTLPEGSGFTAQMDGMKNNFHSDFETRKQDNKHIAGDGSCQIEVDGMSSRVTIFKAE